MQDMILSEKLETQTIQDRLESGAIFSYIAAFPTYRLMADFLASTETVYLRSTGSDLT